MPDYHLIGRHGEDIPTALSGPTGQAGDVGPGDMILFTFPCHSHDAAMGVFRTCRDAGIRRTFGQKFGPDRIGEWWQFPGAPGHLAQAAREMGVSIGAISRAEQEPPVKAIGGLVGNAYGLYTKVCGPGKENRPFTNEEKRPILGFVVEAEKQDARLHAMARAGRTMLEVMRSAFGLPPGEYRYRVASSNEEATVALRAELDVARVEIERLNREALERGALHQADLDRLRAENAELLDRNKQLAAMVESLTQPAPADPPTTADTDRRQPPTTADTSSPSSQSKPTPPRPPHNKGR